MSTRTSTNINIWMRDFGAKFSHVSTYDDTVPSSQHVHADAKREDRLLVFKEQNENGTLYRHVFVDVQ